MRTVTALVMQVAGTGIAVAQPASQPAAEPATESAVLLGDRWPSVPVGHGLSLEDQITDRLTLLGNELGRHLDLLSHDMFQLTVDGRRRHAHVRVGAGSAGMLALGFDGDVQFDDIDAHVRARIALGFHGHAMHLELPDFVMSPAEYRGDYGVEVRLPLFVRKF